LAARREQIEEMGIGEAEGWEGVAMRMANGANSACRKSRAIHPMRSQQSHFQLIFPGRTT